MANEIIEDNDLAECCICGRNKPVCCDSGYRDLADGTTEHDDCMCKDCCTNYHGRCSEPNYERADCDL